MTVDNEGLAGVIRIENGAGHQRLLIDGEPFPWLIAENGPTYSPGAVPIVLVPILADRVEVLDTGVDPFPSEATGLGGNE